MDFNNTRVLVKCSLPLSAYISVKKRPQSRTLLHRLMYVRCNSQHELHICKGRSARGMDT